MDVLCRGLEKNGMVGAWHGHGMASVNQTRPHCINQIGKTHSKLLAARQGRGTAWARHAMCESALKLPPSLGVQAACDQYACCDVATCFVALLCLVWGRFMDLKKTESGQ